jgi:hypothetical protein
MRRMEIGEVSVRYSREILRPDGMNDRGYPSSDLMRPSFVDLEPGICRTDIVFIVGLFRTS